MSAVSATAGPAPVQSTMNDPLAAADAEASLLAAPDENAARLGPLELMFLVQSRSRQIGLQGGGTEIAKMSKVRDEERKAEAEAQRKAQEEAADRSFWDDLGGALLSVGKVAAVVGSVAIAVVSFGAATPIAALAVAGALASTAGFVQGEFHVLEAVGLDPDVAGWVGVGLSLGGSACSLGVGAFGAAAETTSVVGKVVNVGKTTANVVGASATIAGGGSKIAASGHAAAEANFAADAKASRNEIARLQRMVAKIIDELRAADADDARMMGHIQGTIEARDAALSASVRA